MIKSPVDHPSQNQGTPVIWQWGRWSVYTWSMLVYLAIILAQMLFGLAQSGTWPVWANDYTVGAYPSFWLVYVCLPLGIRDLWVSARLNQPTSSQTRWSTLILIAASLVSFHWVYGWY